MPIVVSTPLPVGTGLDLCALWLNDAEDLADLMALGYAGDSIAIAAAKRAEVRQLANRRRVVTSTTKVYETVGLTLQGVTTLQRQWLRDHVGRLLCFRDHLGSKIYAAYMDAPFEIATSPRTDGVYYARVSLTLEQVDHSEAV